MIHFDRIQQKLLFALGLLVVILSGFLIFLQYNARVSGSATDLTNGGQHWEQNQPDGIVSVDTSTDSSINASSEEVVTPVPIKVYITGHVKHPGVISLLEGDRVEDAIALAGGFLAEADLNRINLALKVKDEGMYYVPFIGEEISINPLTHTIGEETEGKVNINQADQTQLETLPGIGPAKALKILEYRGKYGNFQSIEEIMNVSGIGEKTYENLKDSITIR